MFGGTGDKAKQVIKRGIRFSIAGFIESKILIEKEKVYEPEDIINYDAIIVASLAADDIFMTAKKIEMNLEKFIFMNECHYINPGENLELKKAVLSEVNYQTYLGIYKIYDKSFLRKIRKNILD